MIIPSLPVFFSEPWHCPDDFLQQVGELTGVFLSEAALRVTIRVTARIMNSVPKTSQFFFRMWLVLKNDEANTRFVTGNVKNWEK
jgi:hypothetical protein